MELETSIYRHGGSFGIGLTNGTHIICKRPNSIRERDRKSDPSDFIDKF